MRIKFEESDKKHFFGDFVKDPVQFKFSDYERSLLTNAVNLLEKQSIDMSPSKEKSIHDKSKSFDLWFNEEIDIEANDQTELSKPGNLLDEMNKIARINALRPKQGYRYDNNYKRFCVYNRILSGPTASNLLHFNLDGCYPSLSTMNRYIHRSDHAIVEGELRADELLQYLKDRKLPLWVSLSEDATRVEDKVKYDARTNQIIGFILPTNRYGMPTPFRYKARNIDEILEHFSKGIPVSNFINTIMAQPFGDAPSFCLLVFGTNGQYTAKEVSSRWQYVCDELKKVGVEILTMSSDSDPRYNSAMRFNSGLGHSSNDSSMLFKCGTNPNPPFYTQDYYHELTKLRNLFLKSIDQSDLFPFGNYFVKVQHLQEIMVRAGKDKHNLTPSCLNPLDRQNVDSAKRICDSKVIKLLKQMVNGSEGTAEFLQIMSDVYLSFEDEKLEPLERVRRLWRSLFLVRIWRNFILNSPGLTLKQNFMSANCFSCIEQNAHSMVFIMRYLRNEQLTHLFFPPMYSSQPCESFYRQLRSLTTVSSTVVNFDTKGVLDRISRIHLMNEISNDNDSGFTYPKSLSTFKQPDLSSVPSDKDIINTIKESKEEALSLAIKIGLIQRKSKLKDSFCVCPLSPYEFKMSKKKKKEHEISDICDEESEDAFQDLYMKTIAASLKNYADKIDKSTISETSSYVEIEGNKRRLVFKKTSICWLLGKNSYKCSSDRLLRVRANTKRSKEKAVKNARKKANIKSFKILRKSKSINKKR